MTGPLCSRLTVVKSAYQARLPLYNIRRWFMKKYLIILRDIFEIYVPVASFSVMFIVFILQVFFRYALHYPLTWSMEVIVLCFDWTVLFGACYTMRKRAHVKFTMIYDWLPPRQAAAARGLGNLIIAAAFICLLPGSTSYSFFAGFQKTAVFRMSLTVFFLPFVYFLCSVIGYTVADILEDIRILRGIIPDSAEHEKEEAAG
jgi:TRAP-type C4-dicarboxylate transport system permease small subunit